MGINNGPNNMPYYGIVLLITDDNLFNTEWIVMIYSITKKCYVIQFAEIKMTS